MERPDGSSRWNIRMLQHRWRIQMIHMPAHMHFQHFHSSPHQLCLLLLVGTARSKANSASTPKKLHQSAPSETGDLPVHIRSQ